MTSVGHSFNAPSMEVMVLPSTQSILVAHRSAEAKVVVFQKHGSLCDPQFCMFCFETNPEQSIFLSAPMAPSVQQCGRPRTEAPKKPPFSLLGPTYLHTYSEPLSVLQRTNSGGNYQHLR